MSRVSIVFLFLVAMQPVEAANPIRKVVMLMQEMQKEIGAEKEKEKELFEKFMCICSEYPPELRETIDEGNKKIEELTSKIEEETAQNAKIGEELKVHNTDKAAAETDLSKATKLREKEADEYESTVSSTKASVEGLGNALESLEKGASAANLMQASGVPHLQAMIETTGFLSSLDRQRVIAFLTGATADSANAPSSGEVVGILKQMKSDMDQTLVDAEDAEKVAQEGFAGLKSAKDKEITVAAETIEEKEKKSGELEVSIAQSTDALDDTKAEVEDSQAMLKTLETTCDSRKLEWEARLKLRDDEIAAISEAINILNDDDALDVFKKAVPSDSSDSSGFLQTRRGHTAAVDKFGKAVAIVRKAVDKSHHTPLELLLYKMSTQFRAASKSSSAPDFKAVAKMVDDMIKVLTSEVDADEKKKEWCVAEVAKSEDEQKAKQEKVDSLSATIAEISDEIAGVDEDVASLEKDISSIDKEVASSTEQRKKEHAEYTENLQMTEVAIQLLAKAKNRLNKFYNPSVYKAPPKKEMTMEDKITGGVGFIQRHVARKSRDMPDLPDLPEYKKKESGGVIALMDKISKQLEMDSVESGHEEKTAQSEYVAFMAEAQKNRAANEKSAVQKKGSKAELEKRLVKIKEESKVTQEELYKAHEFVMEMHSACDLVLETYKERQEARSAEIESLKNAKAVLMGADF